MEGEEEASVAEQLLQACQYGDAETLHQLITSSAGVLELSVTTEDGATLIINTVIAAGLLVA